MLALVVCALGSPATAADDQPKYSDAVIAQAEKILQEHGLRRVGSQIQPLEQTNFNRLISDENRLRRALRLTRKAWEQATAATQGVEQRFDALEQQYGALNARFAAVGNPAGRNNDLVVQINAMGAQLKQLVRVRTASREETQQRRAALGKEEEQYAELVLKMRRAVDAMRETVVAAADVEDVKIAFRVLATRHESPAEIDIESIIAPLDRRVRKLEEAIFSETIPLEESGGGWMVQAVVGLEPVQMLVDSGASIVLIPHDLGQKANIKPADDARDLTMVMADGRRMTVKEVFLPRLRVGQFEAENVRAALLDEGVPGAKPLLGLSFLERFRFEIDSPQKQLKLLRIDDSE
ncbi:retropepsin-like aspartic protease family protein [Planctomycetaceae bacterium SH139]